MKKGRYLIETIITFLVMLFGTSQMSAESAKVFASDPLGDQVLVWNRNTVSKGGKSVSLVVSGKNNGNYSWDPPAILSTCPEASLFEITPSVVSNKKGCFVMVWRQEVTPYRFMIYFSTKDHNQAWTTPQILSINDMQHGSCTSFQLSNDDNGNCLLTWVQQMQDYSSLWQETIWTAVFTNHSWTSPEMVAWMGEE